MQTTHTNGSTPRPDARFWDRIAERYARQPIADSAHYERKLALTQQYLRPDSRVLELGCGTGTTALHHAPAAGSILATDISAGMIDIARRRLAEAGPANLEFRCTDLEGLAEPAGSFDMVLALNLLHLVADRAAMLRRVHTLLKPDGLLVTSTVCLTGAWHLLRPVFALGAMAGRIPRVQFFPPASHERELADAGFVIVDRLAPPKPTSGVFLVSRRADQPDGPGPSSQA